MNPIEYKITLDCRRAESQVTITAKQGEASGRKITFSLNEGRLPYKVPSGVTAVLRAKKPSGAVLYNTCTVTADGNVEYIITTQTVAEVGKLPCELQLSQDGKVIFSPNFTLLVYKNLSVDSEVESSDEFTALQAAINRAESLTAGTTFTPAVSEDGVLSWTNDGGKANPEPVNIKGPQGEDGAFRINVTYSNGVYSADKTFDEIKAAYNAGQQPYVVEDALSGFDIIYTLSHFWYDESSTQGFADFERHLILEDTLKTETLRIYSYTLAGGSNIEQRISAFNVPSGSVVIEGTVSGDMSEVTITTPDAWTLVSEAWNSEKRPLVVLRLSDELYAYLTSVSTMTIDGQSQGMALFSLPPTQHLGSTPPYSIWLDESGGASILPVESAVKSVNGKTGAVTLNASDVGAQRPLTAGSGITIIESEDGDIIQSDAVCGNGEVSFVDVAGGAPIASFTLNQTQDCEINVNDLIQTPLLNDYRTAAAQDVIDAGKQDKLIAGEGITIAADGKTISSSGKVSSVNGKTGIVKIDVEDIHYANSSRTLDGTIGGLKRADAQMATDISNLQTADASLDSRITAIETGDTPVTLYIYWESVTSGGRVSLTQNGVAMSVTDFISKMQSGAKIIIGENNDTDSESSGFTNYRYKITDSTTASLAFDVTSSFNGSNRTIIISGSSSTDGLMSGYQDIAHDDLSDYSPLPEGSTPASKAWVEDYVDTKLADGIIIPSSTVGSTKRFKLTVDDSGVITATEVTT